jgi:hypothetical protein
MFVLSTKRNTMTWRPLGEPNHPPLENEMLWTNLAYKAQDEVEGQTVIHCKYVSKEKYANGGWVNIYDTTFLVNPDTRDMLRLVQAYNVPISPEKYYFKQVRQLKKFTLVFPNVHKHWKHFNLLEITGKGGGFHVTDIVRNESGVYNIELS